MRQPPLAAASHAPFRPRFPRALLIAGCLLRLALPSVSEAQENKPRPPNEPIGIEDNSWARFAVGSWKLVRISKEVFDQNGKLESMTVQEGKTTLTSFDGSRFTLQEEVTLEVAGKRFKSAIRTVERGLNDETQGQTVTTRSLGKKTVTICRQEYPVQMHEITVSDEKMKRVSTLYYSPEVEPFILKRDTICTDQIAKMSFESSVEVLAVDMPYRVLAEVKPTSHIKTVHLLKNLPQGDQTPDSSTIVTLEVSCAYVPGHIVAHTSKKIDAEGRLTERSTLELLDYEVAGKQVGARDLGRPRLFGKGRLRGNTR